MINQVFRNGVWSKAPSGAKYTGAKTGTELNNWPVQAVDPTSFIQETYGTLSARNATLFNTEATAKAAIKKPVVYTVGDGLYFYSMPNADYLGIPKEEALEWGKQLTTLLHYDKLELNWYEKQRLLMTDSSITGDATLQFVREGGELPFDIICSGGYIIDYENNQEFKDGSSISMGIALDKYRRKQGFWTVSGDYVPFKLEDNSQNAIQVFWQRERLNQVRGYGCMNALIAHMKNIGTVWDATTQRMVMESVILGFSKATDTDVAEQMRRLADSARASSVQKNVQESSSTGVERVNSGHTPGDILNVKNDESFEYTKLETPSNNFRNAVEESNIMIAQARGVSPGFLRGLYPTSFSSANAELGQTYMGLDVERADFVRNTDYQVNLELLKSYVRRGMLKVRPDFFQRKDIQRAYLNGKTLGPVPGYINPLAGAKTEQLLENDGIITKAERIQRQGSNDPAAHLQEWGFWAQDFADKAPEEKQQIMNAE